MAAPIGTNRTRRSCPRRSHISDEVRRYRGSRQTTVYFVCMIKSLLRWDGQQFSVIHLPSRSRQLSGISTSFSGRLFVHAKHQPYSEVVGDHLEAGVGRPCSFRETTVTGAIELAKDKILLVTRDKGIFELHDSLSSVAPDSAKTSDFAKASSDKPSDESAMEYHVVPFKTDADDLFTRQSYVEHAHSDQSRPLRGWGGRTRACVS